MLKFTDINQKNPSKRNEIERKNDFDEIYAEFIHENANKQSSRCSQCGVPFCQVHCPLSNNIPDWLKLTAENRLEEAYELSQSTNNMPEVCGRICPQDRLCEGNCVIEQSGHGTVTIGSIEKYITETAWTKGWVKPIEVKNEINKDASFVVFHDAYQYFEKRFEVNILGAFTVNTDVLPGAEQLAEIREIIEHDKVSCIFSEPQFNPDIINAVAKDMNIKTGVLDPLGATLEPGKDLYFDLIKNMSKSFKGC